MSNIGAPLATTPLNPAAAKLRRASWLASARVQPSYPGSSSEVLCVAWPSGYLSFSQGTGGNSVKWQRAEELDIAGSTPHDIPVLNAHKVWDQSFHIFWLVYQVAFAFCVATFNAFAMGIMNRGECGLRFSTCNLWWGRCSWCLSSLCIQPTLKLYKLISSVLIRIHSIGIIIVVRIQTSCTFARGQVRINDFLQGAQILDNFKTIYWNHMISIKIPMILIKLFEIKNGEQTEIFLGVAKAIQSWIVGSRITSNLWNSLSSRVAIREQ